MIYVLYNKIVQCDEDFDDDGLGDDPFETPALSDNPPGK
jgi:hypothetical protein